MTMTMAAQHPGDQHEVPEYEAHASTTSLKDRIKQHYDIASDYYYSLWGQHIHHGLFKHPGESKEEAQVNLISYLLELSHLPRGARVLDVGCGIGGTTRFLAREHGCDATGITISGRQVEIAKKLTLEDGAKPPSAGGDGLLSYGEGTAEEGGGARSGTVRFLELDAEKMLEYFSPAATAAADANAADTEKEGKGGREPSSPPFNCVWISEALSHLPNKPLFFASSFAVLAPGSSSRLVVADWFKAPDLTPEQTAADIRPIEDGMLLPRLFTAQEYVQMAEGAGFRTLRAPVDISAEVAKTWDISWSLVSSPSLWAFAISQGRDGLAFLQAFRAMRRGYANGSFRYAVMCFEKP